VDEVVALRPALRRRARQLCGSEAEADDLVHDTIERVLRASRFPECQAEYRPWMMRMLTNLWIDRLRALKVRRAVPLADDLPAEAGSQSGFQPWKSLSMSDVRGALAAVPEPYRTPYRLFAFEGRSYQEVAADLALPTNTVGTRILRARRCLRQILQERWGKSALAGLAA
jgi:RNA polymerase sigma-70 factor (ECF subfamily)